MRIKKWEDLGYREWGGELPTPRAQFLRSPKPAASPAFELHESMDPPFPLEMVHVGSCWLQPMCLTNPALKWVSYWISRSLFSFTSLKDLFSCDWCENLLQTTQSWRPNCLSMLPWSLRFHLDKIFFFFQWPKLLIKPFYKSWVGLVTKECLTLVTPWTVDQQAPLSMGFPKQEYWSGLPFPSPEDLSNPGI